MTTTNLTNISLAEVAERLKGLDNFVICGHVSPDGDCIGSQLALAHALRALSKNVACVLARNEPLNETFMFMPGAAQMVPACTYDGPCDVFISVDVSVRGRIADAAELLDKAAVSFTLDHHASSEPLCNYEFVDPDSPSCSLIVWDLVKDLLCEPPIVCAECAYVGLVTDTGGFRFQNATAQAFAGATDLVAHGAKPAQVATEVFQNRSLPSLKLQALVLDRMQIFCEDQAVLSWVEQADLQRFDAQKSDCEPLIDSIRALRGTRVACMLREQQDSIRGSLRAKDDTDVASLARTLNGGGHRAAAGFTLYMPMNEAIPFMQQKITELLSQAAAQER